MEGPVLWACLGRHFEDRSLLSCAGWHGGSQHRPRPCLPCTLWGGTGRRELHLPYPPSCPWVGQRQPPEGGGEGRGRKGSFWCFLLGHEVPAAAVPHPGVSVYFNPLSIWCKNVFSSRSQQGVAQPPWLVQPSTTDATMPSRRHPLSEMPDVTAAFQARAE